MNAERVLYYRSTLKVQLAYPRTICQQAYACLAGGDVIISGGRVCYWNFPRCELLIVRLGTEPQRSALYVDRAAGQVSQVPSARQLNILSV